MSGIPKGTPRATHCKKCGERLAVANWQQNGKLYEGRVCRACAAARSHAWYHSRTPEQKRLNVKRQIDRYWSNPEAYLFRTIKARKNIKGRKRVPSKCAVNLTFQEFLDEIGGEIPKKCPILGIPIRMARGSPDDRSPSVDRIDNDRPYERGNIAIISRRANFLKRDGTADEHRRIADWMDRMQGRQKRPRKATSLPKTSGSQLTLVWRHDSLSES